MDKICVFSLSACHDEAVSVQWSPGLLSLSCESPLLPRSLLFGSSSPSTPSCGHCPDSFRLLYFLPFLHCFCVSFLLLVVSSLTPISEIHFLMIQQSILMELLFTGLCKHLKFLSTFQLSYNPKRVEASQMLCQLRSCEARLKFLDLQNWLWFSYIAFMCSTSALMYRLACSADGSLRFCFCYVQCGRAPVI